MKVDKNFLFILIGRELQAGISILTIRIMTTVLAKDEIGSQYLIQSIILWFSLVLINPFGMFINRHVHEWFQSNQLVSALKKMNAYFLGVGIVSIPIVYFAKEVLSIGANQSTVSVMVLVFLYIYLSTWFQTLTSFFNLFNYQKHFVFLNISSQALGLIFAYGLTIEFQMSAFYWMLGLLVGQFASLLMAFLFLRQNQYFNSKTQINAKLNIFTKERLHFCLPVALATVFMWFQTQGYRLIIEKSSGVELLAILGVSLGVAASLASIVESLATQYLYPKYYAQISNVSLDSRKQAWQLIWRAAISIYIPSAIAVMAVSSIVLKILTGPVFHMYGSFVAAGACLELFRQLTNIVYLVSHSEKKTAGNILPYFAGSLILLLGLIYRYYFSVISLNWIILLLISAYFITLLLNSFVAFRLASIRFYFFQMLQITMMCIPVLLLRPYLESISITSVVLSCLIGLYSLGVMFYFLKKIDFK